MIKFTLDQKLELKNEILSINSKAWPEFMLNWDCEEWSQLYSTFSNFQVAFMENDKITAFGHTIPLYWDDCIEKIPDDLKILIETAIDTHKRAFKPNLLLALAVVVAPDYKGAGLSSEILDEMKKIAIKNDISTLIVPVRPTLKRIYPLISIESYSKWVRGDGYPYDPWLRVHKKLGGEVFKTADVSMVIKGNISEWERWTKLKIFDSGKYVFDGGLNPVNIYIENDIGIYTDPCIWFKYNMFL